MRGHPVRFHIALLLLFSSACAKDRGYADHPMGLAFVALRDTAFTWLTQETDHFRIHYQAGSYAADHIEQFVDDAEQARGNGLQVIGADRFRSRIDVFHLTSREQM